VINIGRSGPDETWTSYGRYDYGFGDIYLTALRLGEMSRDVVDSARNQIRALLTSPALDRGVDCAMEDRESFTYSEMRRHPDTAEFLMKPWLKSSATLVAPLPSCRVKSLSSLLHLWTSPAHGAPPYHNQS
jgi:hypothetical protein